MIKKSKSEYGVSLIELLVVMGIMAILAGVGMSLAGYFSSVKKSAKAMTTQLELRSGFETAMKTSCGCNYALAGSELSYPGSGDLVLPTVRYYAGCSTPKDIVVDSGGNLPWANSTLKVTSMKIINIIPDGSVANSYIGDIKIDMADGSFIPAPVTTVSKPFQFKVNPVAPNKLTECNYNGPSAVAAAASGGSDLAISLLKISLYQRFIFQEPQASSGQACNLEVNLPPDPINTMANGNKIIVYKVDQNCPADYFEMAACYRNYYVPTMVHRVCLYNGPN